MATAYVCDPNFREEGSWLLLNSCVFLSTLNSFLSARCSQRALKPWNRLPRVVEEPYWAEDIKDTDHKSNRIYVHSTVYYA